MCLLFYLHIHIDSDEIIGYFQVEFPLFSTLFRVFNCLQIGFQFFLTRKNILPLSASVLLTFFRAKKNHRFQTSGPENKLQSIPSGKIRILTAKVANVMPHNCDFNTPFQKAHESVPETLSLIKTARIGYSIAVGCCNGTVNLANSYHSSLTFLLK
jgi:hypothetical protein